MHIQKHKTSCVPSMTYITKDFFLNMMHYTYKEESSPYNQLYCSNFKENSFFYSSNGPPLFPSHHNRKYIQILEKGYIGILYEEKGFAEKNGRTSIGKNPWFLYIRQFSQYIIILLLLFCLNYDVCVCIRYIEWVKSKDIISIDLFDRD